MELPVNYELISQNERRLIRAEYEKLQKGLCHHCSSPLENEPPKKITSKRINCKLFPKNFLRYPVHLHHNHKTGMTIGAVHSYCNAVLWQYHGK